MILIAIGANLPDARGASPLQNCRRAAVLLDSLSGLRLRALSRWYLTAPVPPSRQPKFINGVALLEVAPGVVAPEPAGLLAMVQAIEALVGRVRGEPNAARSLDLDIVAMGEEGQMVRAAPDPVLPHPRAHLRAFVLVPLVDVAPRWCHPVLRRCAEDLLTQLPEQDVRLL